MREIKFRAWYEPTKEMLLDVSVASVGWIYKDGRFDTHNDYVMQYTGLKDKDGVEIYEGDIVYTGGLNCVAEWLIGEARFHLRRQGIQSIPQSTHLDNVHKAQYKVIGNIYENPELLKEAEVK